MKILNFVSNASVVLSNIKKSILGIKDAICDQKNEIKSHFRQLKKNLRDLRNTNLDLAIYHINKGNINDAILRLKIIDIFISKNDKSVFANMAWCYFMKGDKSKALEYLSKISVQDDILKLKAFLEDNDLEEIPGRILDEYRRISAELYLKKWKSYSLYLPKAFIKSLFDNIDVWPSSCKVLDLGCSAGFIGAELDYKLPKNYTITGIDNIEVLTKYANDGGKNIYDQIYNISVREFLSQSHLEKYNIITSFCSLDFAKDLSAYFKKIKNILSDDGCFAFVVQTSSSCGYNINSNNFVYVVSDLEKQLILAKFKILDIKKWKLSQNSFYSMFIVK